MMDLETISAHLEIQQTIARYCRGVDRGDAELIKSVYHPDGIQEAGPMFNGLGIAFADFLVTELDKSSAICNHFATNIYIELDGDMARVESYFFAVNSLAEPEGAVDVAVARHLDRFECRDGVWKIAHSRIVLDWSHSAVLPVDTWEPHRLFPNGDKREKDPSHNHFLRK